MTILEIVEDAISNAYYNGYNAEIESLSDEELAWDFIDSGVFEESVDVTAVITAIREFRNVRDC